MKELENGIHLLLSPAGLVSHSSSGTRCVVGLSTIPTLKLTPVSVFPIVVQAKKIVVFPKSSFSSTSYIQTPNPAALTFQTSGIHHCLLPPLQPHWFTTVICHLPYCISLLTSSPAWPGSLTIYSQQSRHSDLFSRKVESWQNASTTPFYSKLKSILVRFGGSSVVQLVLSMREALNSILSTIKANKKPNYHT